MKHLGIFLCQKKISTATIRLVMICFRHSVKMNAHFFASNFGKKLFGLFLKQLTIPHVPSFLGLHVHSFISASSGKLPIGDRYCKIINDY